MLFKLSARENLSAKTTSLAFISFKLINSSSNLINGRMPNAYTPIVVGSPRVVPSLESIPPPPTINNLDRVA